MRLQTADERTSKSDKANPARAGKFCSGKPIGQMDLQEM